MTDWYVPPALETCNKCEAQEFVCRGSDIDEINILRNYCPICLIKFLDENIGKMVKMKK